MKFSKKTLLYFFIFALLVVLSRLPSYNILLDTDSSVNAFFARQILRGETLYDRFHTAHHLPGIYYTFLFSFNLFGDQPAAPKLLLFAFIFAGTWLLFLMGRSFFDELTGALGAFFYILGTSQHYLAGNTVEMEHFANMPMIASIFLFYTFIKRNASPVQYIWIGILGAICILYKVTFIASLASVGVAVLISAWMERGQTGNVKKMLLRLAGIAVGVAIPLSLVGLYFANLGLWQRFMLVFTLGFEYANDQSLIVPFPKPFGFPLFMLAMTNIVLLIIGLIGAYRLTYRSITLRTSENLIDITLVLWLIFSLILAGFRGGGYQHYVLVVIPPLVMTAANEIASSYYRWQPVATEKQASFGAGFITFLILLNFLWRNIELYRYYFINPSDRQGTFQVEQARQTEVFDYIRSNTTREDFIYIWSIKLQTYYYADRLPPIDILWPSYVSATGPPERIFDPRTKYIVVADSNIFSRPEWLLKGLEQYYFLETTINGMEIYRRTGL